MCKVATICHIFGFHLCCACEQWIRIQCVHTCRCPICVRQVYEYRAHHIGTQELVAQRSFVVQRPARTQDAVGGVQALAAAADAAILEIDAWVEQVQASRPAAKAPSAAVPSSTTPSAARP